MTGISMLDLSLLRFTLGRVNNRSMEGNLPATKQLHFGHSNRAGRMMLVMGPSPPWGGLDPFSVEAARSGSMQCPSKRAGSIASGLRSFCYFGGTLTRQRCGGRARK